MRSEKVVVGDENVTITPDHVAIEELTASQNTIRKAQAVFKKMGADGNLITKLKKAGLIKAVSGYGKVKYKFIEPKA